MKCGIHYSDLYYIVLFISLHFSTTFTADFHRLSLIAFDATLSTSCLLLYSMLDMIHWPDASQEKWTALHYASSYGKTSCVQLLCAGKANPNLKDKFGRTPLYLASQRGHTAVSLVCFSKSTAKNLMSRLLLHWSVPVRMLMYKQM